MKKYLNEKALVGLRNYKYKSGEYGVLDHVMAHWWNYALEFVPIWMAPNLVTLTGLAALLSGFFMVISHDLTMQADIPYWVSIYLSFALFLYQTLDAIDGKQARRTGTSSPLGQLFDHGCDAFATFCVLYSFCHIVNLTPDNPIFSFLYIGFICAFYAANWEEGHTHCLRCCTTIFGVTFGLTESQWIMILTLLLNGLTNNGFKTITLGELYP